MIAIPKRDPDYDLHFLLFPVYHHISIDPVFTHTTRHTPAKYWEYQTRWKVLEYNLFFPHKARR